MSAIIEASDIACASAAFDLSCAFHKNLSPNERVALVAQLFADHREKAEAECDAQIKQFVGERDLYAKLVLELREEVAALRKGIAASIQTLEAAACAMR